MLRACPHHDLRELTQVDTFYNGLNENDQDSLNAAAGGNLLSKTTREALNIIENKSKVRYSRNKSNVSRMNTTSRESVSKTDERIDKLADQLSTLVEIVSKKVVTPAPVKAVEEICVTCSGPHAWYNCPNTDNNQSSVCAATGTYNQVNPPNRVSNQMAPPGFAPVQNNSQNSGFFQNQASTLGTLPSNTIPNPKGEMKAITTRSGVAYEGPSIPTNPSPKKVVKQETKESTDKEQTNFQGSTAHILPPVNPIPIPKPGVLKTLPKPNIPYPSRRNNQKSRDKASNQMEKIFQIFQDLRFDISFVDALLLMPRFAPTIKSLLMNKEKLLELAKIPLNENCSAGFISPGDANNLLGTHNDRLFWVVSFKVSLSSALIATISLLIIVVVVAVVVVAVFVVSICRSASTILGQMANLFAVIAPRPGLCSPSYSAVVGFNCSWKDHHTFFSFLPDIQHRHGSSHPSTKM
ncbi:hypothetical protein Tco_0546691 [Tanacetum coccineum]